MTQHLVFLPGTLCDEHLFANQTQEFKNSEVLNLRNSASIDEMLELVKNVSTRRFVLIGFSMGGHVAQEFALKFPERVEKLIIIAASSTGYPPDEKKIVLNTLPLIERGKFTGISDKRLKKFLHPQSYANEELRGVIKKMNGSSGSVAKEVYLRQTRATLDRRDLIESMKNLQVPTLFIGGADDEIVSFTSIRQSAENVPGSQLIAVNQCGHFVPLEQPEILNQAILDFLQF